MKKIFFFMLLSTIFINAQEKNSYSDYPISSVDIKNVELNDNFWLPKIKVIQDTTIHYSFDKCDSEGRMQNFLVAGGKIKGG